MADDERYQLRTRIAGELRRLIDRAIADDTELTIALAPTHNCRLEILIDRATITGFRVTLLADGEALSPVFFPRDSVMGDSPGRARMFAKFVGAKGAPVAA